MDPVGQLVATADPDPERPTTTPVIDLIAILVVTIKLVMVPVIPEPVTRAPPSKATVPVQYCPASQTVIAVDKVVLAASISYPGNKSVQN